MMRKTGVSLTKPQEVDVHVVGEKCDGFVWNGSEWVPDLDASIRNRDDNDGCRPEDETPGHG